MCCKACDLIAAEDTRVTAKLLAIHGISKPLTAYNDHNAAQGAAPAAGRLREGARIALVSDAGTPLVSDPGFKLVREAIAGGLAGACPARALGGADRAGAVGPADRPVSVRGVSARQGGRAPDRAGRIEERPRHVDLFRIRPSAWPKAWRTWRRFWARAAAAVAREMTKLHEEVRRGTLAELGRSL